MFSDEKLRIVSTILLNRKVLLVWLCLCFPYKWLLNSCTLNSFVYETLGASVLTLKMFSIHVLMSSEHRSDSLRTTEFKIWSHTNSYICESVSRTHTHSVYTHYERCYKAAVNRNLLPARAFVDYSGERSTWCTIDAGTSIHISLAQKLRTRDDMSGDWHPSVEFNTRDSHLAVYGSLWQLASL